MARPPALRIGRKAHSAYLRQLLVCLLLSAVLVSGSRGTSRRSRKHSHLSVAPPRWQSRALLEGIPSAANDLQVSNVKPAPFSKPGGAGHTGGGSLKRSYYVPTVTNLENKLHHFINNLKTGIGSSKLAHAVNGVTSSLQHSLSAPGAVSNLLNGAASRPSGLHSAPGHYGTANELRYGQPFVSKQVVGHYKTGPESSGHKGHGKRGRHSSSAASPAKYDSLMSDLGISGYKHFENAVIRDLERREELKVEATIHTLFPDDDGDWQPISPNRNPKGVLDAASQHSEPQVVTVSPDKRRPQHHSTSVKPPAKSKPSTGGTLKSTVSTAPPGQKHRPKVRAPKERTKCWNCVSSTSSTTSGTTKQSSHHHHHQHHSSPPPKVPLGPRNESTHPRYGPTYDATMFYGADGKQPAGIVSGALAQSYSNVEVHYNRTLAPPFAASPWTQPLGPSGLLQELSTQPAPPVTTFAGLPSDIGTSVPHVGPSFAKKSFSKLVPKLGHGADGTTGTTSTTTHKPTGASPGGTKGTTSTTKKQKASHKHTEPTGSGHRRFPPATSGKGSTGGDSFGSGSVKHEQRAKKKFDPKYSRNRGSIKFKDALKQNPDQIYR
ncbi:uncharacterized protein LOC128270193 [Anopheles cruzii]|uniref:uncharacterized protein LOC128270193 n=1 Tax=Anopheles cruzii TaxID=68878 RepID=UPI0022EC8FAC|nr:uncharacterized protein LOC128270193 [Anopheles cruzii]